MKLVVGTKSKSSWSLRPYLALAQTGAPFDEVVVELDRPDTRARLLEVSPTAKVPVLLDGDLAIWDSLAICEYLHERFPEAQLWPKDPKQRARARSISAEMHSSFTAMRRDFSMDLRADHAGENHTPDALADASRVMEIWRDARARATGGPFLFGHFTIADAMYAPVATRLQTYAVPMDDVAKQYVAAIEALPAMQAWRRAARAEND
jgi:glutathione S-transferase